MRVEIEIYRGWEISFNTDTEEFYCMSNDWDKDINKKSFASAKKYIDDYIKANTEFKTFIIEKMPSIYSKHKKLKVVGIRKDKRFSTEEEDGTKGQLSEYDEKDWFLYNPANQSHFDKIKELEEEIRLIRENIDQEAKLVKKVTVKDHKKNLGL